MQHNNPSNSWHSPWLILACALATSTGHTREADLDAESPERAYSADEIALTRQRYVDTSPAVDEDLQYTTSNSDRDRPENSPNQSVLFKPDTFTIDVPNWVQSLLAQRMEYKVGWVASSSLYSVTAEQNPLSTLLPAGGDVPMPGSGFGAYGSIQANPSLAITAGVHEDVSHRWNGDSVDRSAWFSALGINYQPQWAEAGSENYKLSVWRRNSAEQDAGSSGMALNLEKHFQPNLSLSPFMRFNYQRTDTFKTSTSAAAGINVGKLPWSRDARLGFAYSHQEDTDKQAATRTYALYYRMQPTPYLEMTPDVQLIKQPGDTSELATSVISRLNFRLLF